MFLIRDIRESRVYQEGVEEGTRQGTAFVIGKLAAKKMTPAAEIAAILELDVEFVRQVLANSERN